MEEQFCQRHQKIALLGLSPSTDPLHSKGLMRVQGEALPMAGLATSQASHSGFHLGFILGPEVCVAGFLCPWRGSSIVLPTGLVTHAGKLVASPGFLEKPGKISSERQTNHFSALLSESLPATLCPSILLQLRWKREQAWKIL